MFTALISNPQVRLSTTTNAQGLPSPDQLLMAAIFKSGDFILTAQTAATLNRKNA